MYFHRIHIFEILIQHSFNLEQRCFQDYVPSAILFFCSVMYAKEHILCFFLFASLYLSKQGLAVIKLFSCFSTVGSFTFAVGFRSSFQSFCFLLDLLNPLASTPGLFRFFYVIGRFQKTSGALGSPAMRDRAWFVRLYGEIIPEL